LKVGSWQSAVGNLRLVVKWNVITGKFWIYLLMPRLILANLLPQLHALIFSAFESFFALTFSGFILFQLKILLPVEVTL
jgi:hypothetical protein